MAPATATASMSVDDIERILGYSFGSPKLLTEARTHSSKRGEGALVVNERLEFLGDAVLGLVAAQMAFHESASATEEQMTNRRTELVPDSKLAKVAKLKGLGPALILGGSQQKTGRDTESILAGMVEALIGAVFEDSGFDEASRVSRRLLAALDEPVGSSHKETL